MAPKKRVLEQNLEKQWGPSKAVALPLSGVYALTVRRLTQLHSRGRRGARAIHHFQPASDR